MIKADEYYLESLKKIRDYGTWDENPRPKYQDGTSAHSKFITQVFEKYDISKGEYPVTTLRNTAIKTGIKEIFWIYQKQTSSIKEAHNLGIKWWDDWALTDGTIGQRYGATVNRYDLVNNTLDGLKNNPFSRRHIIDLLQYKDLSDTKGLYPCAYSTLWSVRKVKGEYYLDMTLIQRSSDFIVAGFINKIQYVALLLMFCQHLNYKPGVFSHLIQNLHVYDRHMDAMEVIINRKPLDKQPILNLNSTSDNFYDISLDDFTIKNIKGIQKINSKLELAI